MALTAFAYAILMAAEGVALSFRKPWAHWFTVVATSSLVPVEIYEIVREVHPVLAGVLLGAFASRALMAQKPLTGFYIAEVFEGTNQDDFNTYAAGVPATIAKYGGRYLIRGGKTQSLEGEPPKRIIVHDVRQR